MVPPTTLNCYHIDENFSKYQYPLAIHIYYLLQEPRIPKHEVQKIENSCI